jgi:23S rRNA (guanosine2251-2'-O)-methyltransferase
MPRPQHSRPPPHRGKAAAEPRSARVLLWGTHPVLAALANPIRQCQRLFATREAAAALAARLALLTGPAALPPIEILPRPDLDQMLPSGAQHQGIALQVAPLPSHAVEDIVALAQGRNPAVVVVLDQVTDPHNVGAVLRSAAAFGALGVVMQDRNAPDETGTLAKAASGALEKLPLARVTNLARALDELKAGGFWIAGLAGDAPRTLAEAGLSGRIALVLGSEGDGLRRLTRERCDHLVKLPQSDLVESLNVSNAAAVALYELVR